MTSQPTAAKLVSSVTNAAEQYALASDYAAWVRAIHAGVAEIVRVCEGSASVDDAFMDQVLDALESWRSAHSCGFMIVDFFAECP